MLACNDAFAAVREDRRHDYGEDRYVLLGDGANCLLCVAYTLRGERNSHYFGAARAEPQEKRRYHEENGRD